MDKVVPYTINTLIYQKKPALGFFSKSSEHNRSVCLGYKIIFDCLILIIQHS